MTVRTLLLLAWITIWPVASMSAGIYLATRPERAPRGWFWAFCVIVWPLMPLFVWWEHRAARARLPERWRAGV